MPAPCSGDSTLRNIAEDARAGIAFMNSHRGGGMSHPAELPMGKTFAGRYEEYKDGTKRAVLAFYMLKGQFPNGPSAPSTDAMHAGIAGGTIFDASVGLDGGEKVCDVCGNEVNSTREEEDADGYKRRVRLCAHVPGTTHKMSKDEQATQKARGVKKGTATYTLHNAHCGEVSAVYDGAVPGAGFTKALALARDLTPAERLQARAAYATLLRKGDFDMDEISDAVAGGFERAMLRLGLRRDPEPEMLQAAIGETGPSARETDLATQLAAKEAELAAKETQLAVERRQRAERSAGETATRFIESGYLLPEKQPAFQALYTYLLLDPAARPDLVQWTDALGQAHETTPAEALPHILTRHALFGERVPAGTPLQVLGAESPGVPAARKTALLQKTGLGQTALKAQPPQKET
jgi:hypothetical protein